MKASIIIPSYNAKERLHYNLLALNNQTYEGDDIEVVVVDNGSTDGTFDMLENFAFKYKPVKIRLEENKGIANGRNQGILKATGDLLIFHDSDMIPSKDFIKKHLEAHNEDHLVVCGMPWKRVYTFYYDKFSDKQKEDALCLAKHKLPGPATSGKMGALKDRSPIIKPEMIQNFDFNDAIFDLDITFIRELKQVVEVYGADFCGYTLPWRFFITNNLSVPKSNVVEVGMFDAGIQKYGYEDYDLGIRLYKSGCKIVFNKDITSIHQEHPANFTYLDLIDNINYICDKYNSIHFIDMILVCIGESLGMSDVAINHINSDINRLLPLNKYDHLLHVYLDILQIHRRNVFNNGSAEYLSFVHDFFRDLWNIVPALYDLVYIENTHNLSDALLSMLNNMFGIDLTPLINAYAVNRTKNMKGDDL